ncbi:hypothetical protein J6590_036261, partial [Homalodisca vitripennis]
MADELDQCVSSLLAAVAHSTSPGGSVSDHLRQLYQLLQEEVRLRRWIRRRWQRARFSAER